jgi:hypothetical protein
MSGAFYGRGYSLLGSQEAEGDKRRDQDSKIPFKGMILSDLPPTTWLHILMANSAMSSLMD